MKTNNPISSFDEILREQLSSLSPEVPEGVWESMEGTLDALNESLQFDSAINESMNQLNLPAPDGVFQAIQSQIATGSGALGTGFGLAGKWILGTLLTGLVGGSLWYFASTESTPIVNENSEISEVAKQTESLNAASENQEGAGINQTPQSSNQEGSQTLNPNLQISSGANNAPLANAGVLPQKPINNAGSPRVDNRQNTTYPSTQTKQNEKNTLNPVFGFSKTDTMVCLGQFYTLFLLHADNCTYDVLVNGQIVGRGINGKESFRYPTSESGLYQVACVVRKGEQIWERKQFLYVNPLPEVSITKTDLGNGSYFFESPLKANVTWYLDGIAQKSPQIQLFDPMPRDHRVTALATSAAGCKDSAHLDFKNLSVFEVKALKMPNVFSPDGDGLNDEFKVEVEGATQFQIYIFNAESQLVFESKDPKAGWDGRNKFKENRIEAGRYTCIVKYALAGGELKEEIKWITLIYKE